MRSKYSRVRCKSDRCIVRNKRSVRIQCEPDHRASRVTTWNVVHELQDKLAGAVDREDFSEAAKLRDEIDSLGLTPMQKLELHHVAKLKGGSYDERIKSLGALGEIHASDETQEVIADCLRDERLMVRHISVTATLLRSLMKLLAEVYYSF
jgi:hypothetical protein